ncbi:MAG: hypothetical protein DRP85_08620 [Candidatus Makaraimicrobium thalassicum]|nr:MAG: hypothetical protein DRP85_08620 [Candidatus Omnitrophota bacterium]
MGAIIHGKSDTVLFSRWLGMRNRCYNTKQADYSRYGAKGVTVCDEWKNNFQTFYDWAIENGFSPELQIDKDMLCDELGISPKIYSPNTCKWVTQQENSSYSSKDKGRPVYQYSLEGKFIAEFITAMRASKSTGITDTNISRVCNGIRDTAGGFQWSHNKNLAIPKHVPAIKGFTVLQIDKTTGEVLNEFANAKAAVTALGKTNISPINSMCNGTLLPSGKPRQSAYGYKWKFKNK